MAPAPFRPRGLRDGGGDRGGGGGESDSYGGGGYGGGGYGGVDYQRMQGEPVESSWGEEPEGWRVQYARPGEEAVIREFRDDDGGYEDGEGGYAPSGAEGGGGGGGGGGGEADMARAGGAGVAASYLRGTAASVPDQHGSSAAQEAAEAQARFYEAQRAGYG